VAVVGFLTAGLLTAATLEASAAAVLLSQGKTATASSTENATFPASAAVDGNTGTRWSSAFSDPQWLQVDLGATASISQVVLQWEPAYATGFQIQTSIDAATWTSIYSTTTGTGGTQTLNVTGSGRYIRMYGTARATAYGYSLWEFQVYGALGSSCGTTNAALNHPPWPRQRRTPPSRPAPPWTETPAPGGPQRSATRSGSRSISAVRSPSARSR